MPRLGKGISVKDACLGLTAKRWVNEEGTKIQLLSHKSRKRWKSWLANMGLFGTLHSGTTGIPVPVMRKAVAAQLQCCLHADEAETGN